MANEHEDSEESSDAPADATEDEAPEKARDEAVPTGFSVDEQEGEPQTFEADEKPTDPELEDEAFDVDDESADAELDDEQSDGAEEDEAATTLEGEEGYPPPDPSEAPEDVSDEAFEDPTSPAGYDEVEPSPADDEPEVPQHEGSDETAPAGYDEAELPEEAVTDGEVAETDTSEQGAEGTSEEDVTGGETASAHLDEAPDESDSDRETPETSTEFVLEPELEALRNPPEPEPVKSEPLPEVGTYPSPATLTVYAGGERCETYEVDSDELWIGVGSETPATEEEPADVDAADLEAEPPLEEGEEQKPQPDGATSTEQGPDIDLSEFTDESLRWNRHATLYRQNKNYTLYVTSDGATQHNEELLDLGEYEELEDGDIVIFGEQLGVRFELPETTEEAAGPDAERKEIDADDSADRAADHRAGSDEAFADEEPLPEDELFDEDEEIGEFTDKEGFDGDDSADEADEFDETDVDPDDSDEFAEDEEFEDDPDAFE